MNDYETYYWFDHLLEPGIDRATQTKAIHIIGNKEDFKNDSNKNFLLEVINNEEGQRKVLAIEFLILFFSNEYNVEIYLKNQENKYICLKQGISICNVGFLSKKNILANQLPSLFKSQLSSNRNTRRLGYNLAISIPKEYLKNQYSLLLENQKSNHRCICALSTSLLILHFSEKCDLKTCIYSQLSHNFHVIKRGASLAMNFSKEILSFQLPLLLNKKIFSNENAQRLVSDLLILHFPERCDLKMLLESQSSENYHVRKLGTEQAMNYPKEIMDFQLLLKNQNHLNENIQRLCIDLLILNFPEKFTLEILFESQKSYNNKIRKVGMSAAKRLPKEILKAQMPLLLQNKKSDDLDVKILANTLIHSIE
jgi:hypothetical protein